MRPVKITVNNKEIIADTEKTLLDNILENGIDFYDEALSYVRQFVVVVETILRKCTAYEPVLYPVVADKQGGEGLIRGVYDFVIDHAGVCPTGVCDDAQLRVFRCVFVRSVVIHGQGQRAEQSAVFVGVIIIVARLSAEGKSV